MGCGKLSDLGDPEALGASGVKAGSNRVGCQNREGVVLPQLQARDSCRGHIVREVDLALP